MRLERESGKRMEGVYPILVTPFDEGESIDEESLRNLVEFEIQAGVDGLGIALGSEIFMLSERERRQVASVVVEEAKGRVPVVMSVGAESSHLAVELTREAEEAGVDALMVLPPSKANAGLEAILEYYRAISEATELPIFVQDAPGFTGVEMPASFLARLAEEVEKVRYVKIEAIPSSPKVAEVVRLSGGKLTVFGGAGGDFFIEELKAGARGTNPGCAYPEAFVEVWRQFQEGQIEAAHRAFDRYLRLQKLAGQSPACFYYTQKEVLRRRAVIRSADVRQPYSPPDDLTKAEINLAIECLGLVGN